MGDHHHAGHAAHAAGHGHAAGHAAAHAAAHGHGLIEHAMFVRLMHLGTGAMGGAALAAAVGGYVYQRFVPREGEPDMQLSPRGQYARGPESVMGVPVHDSLRDDQRKWVYTPEEEEEEADADDEEAMARYDERFQRREQSALDLMGWTICGATAGCAGGILYGPLFCHYAYHLPWASSFASTGVAAAFFSPVFAAVGIVGPRDIAQSLPTSVAVTVGAGAVFSAAVLPAGMLLHGAQGQNALYYLAGCRVAASGFSAVLCALFAQRYASIQRRKRPLAGHATAATGCMNRFAIGAGQVGGNAVAGVWMYVALTDWAGAHYPHWFATVPEIYFLCSVIHLLTPSPDHDQRSTTLMARSALVALHALVFIPQFPHGAMMWHNMQIIVGQSFTAGWFGTHAGEWRGRKYIEAQAAEDANEATPVDGVVPGGDADGAGEEEG